MQHSFFRKSFRPCDSRNLNLSPLCTLEKGSFPKFWMERVPKTALINFLMVIYLLHFSGEQDLFNVRVRQLSSLLHLKLAKPIEKETQGRPTCGRLNGSLFSKEI